jgi:hypothetical protein
MLHDKSNASHRVTLEVIHYFGWAACAWLYIVGTISILHTMDIGKEANHGSPLRHLHAIMGFVLRWTRK